MRVLELFVFLKCMQFRILLGYIKIFIYFKLKTYWTSIGLTQKYIYNFEIKD